MPSFDPEQVNNVFWGRDKKIDGGVDILCVGNPGSGKTNAIIQISRSNKKRFGDVIIWRSSAQCQWSYFLNYPAEKPIMWLKHGLDYQLFDRKHEKFIKIEDYCELKRWKTPKELIRKIAKDRINIIETTPHSAINPRQKLQFCHEWAEIFEELNMRKWNNPVTIAFDELEDLVPEGLGKDFWNIELALASFIRAFRKNGISFVASIHSLEEISWRVNKKIRWIVYMSGATLKKSSMIKKYRVNTASMKPGNAYIEGSGGYFENFNFKFKAKEHKFRADNQVIRPVGSVGDNGGAPTIVVQSRGTFTGTVTVSSAGEVTVTNAAAA